MKVIESRYPILVLSYRDCELYCCHLDGYKEDTRALFERMRNIEGELSDKPAGARYRIWYNVDENRLDEPVMRAIIGSVFRLR